MKDKTTAPKPRGVLTDPTREPEDKEGLLRAMREGKPYKAPQSQKDGRKP